MPLEVRERLSAVPKPGPRQRREGQRRANLENKVSSSSTIMRSRERKGRGKVDFDRSRLCSALSLPLSSAHFFDSRFIFSPSLKVRLVPLLLFQPFSLPPSLPLALEALVASAATSLRERESERKKEGATERRVALVVARSCDRPADRLQQGAKPHPLLPPWLLSLSRYREPRWMQQTVFDRLPEIREKAKTRARSESRKRPALSPSSRRRRSPPPPSLQRIFRRP